MTRRTRIRWILFVLTVAAIAWGGVLMLRTDDQPDIADGPGPQPSHDTLQAPLLPDTTTPRDSIPKGPLDTLIELATPPPPPDTTPGPVAVPSGGHPTAPGMAKLLIPVAGVKASQLVDTYDNARSEGRVHNAIDIMAPQNAPVLAATDGPIVKLFVSERGGITIYQMSVDSSIVYYYAHLDHYADNLNVGHFARRGEVIGYVGDTGNAGPGNYHLHFAIWLVTDPKHYWDGEDVNPYPLLAGGG